LGPPSGAAKGVELVFISGRHEADITGKKNLRGNGRDLVNTSKKMVSEGTWLGKKQKRRRVELPKAPIKFISQKKEKRGGGEKKGERKVRCCPSQTTSWATKGESPARGSQVLVVKE